MSTPPTEEAHSDDSSSVQLDQDDQPGPSGTSGQLVPLTLAQATTELPPSGNTSTAPTKRAHPSVPRTCQSGVCPLLQGTQANPPPQQHQGQRHRNTGELGGLLCDRGRTGPGNPLSTRPSPISWEPTTIPRRRWKLYCPSFRETQRLQEELKSINSTLGTIVGVLKELVNTRRDTVAQQGAPDTRLDDELPTTSASASGQEAPPQDHHTSTPPPAHGEPPASGP
ncbi:hypothetical protein NDU88_005963 [Pleurodeles waltl]|uniref:Uncharacterized protein n=1 Tax=Pleurodeles waltl TaxID=8319 RepID=A0AAV7WZ76_PLEWA|nr:hypothetical protein NDU88_005963 [Pleurodeles waltl]